MNTQEGETNVEYAHTIEEVLERLADKDPEIIKAFLVTTLKHPTSRLSSRGLATLLTCDRKQYPGVDNIPEVRKLREGGLTELEKRRLIDEKAIVDLGTLLSHMSEIEFSLTYPSSNEGLGRKETDFRRIETEIEALTKFRQNLRLRKGAGSSIGEAPGKSPV